MGRGVVRDETSEVLVSLDLSQRAPSIWCSPVSTSVGRVADVVQVGRRDQQLGIHGVERRRDPTRLRADCQHVVDPWPQVTEQLVNALLSPLDHRGRHQDRHVPTVRQQMARTRTTIPDRPSL